MRSSTLTALLVVPHGEAGAPGQTAVSLGAVLDEHIVAWGYARLEPDPLSANELLMQISARLTPALQAAPLSSFRDAAARIAAVNLPAALRRAAGESVLTALARRDDMTLAALLCRDYDLPPPGPPPPLHVALSDDAQAAALGRLPDVAALGPTLPARHAAVVFGEDGSRLQRRVRNLCAQLDQAGAPAALHLRLHGGFSRLFGSDIGKALGALYGLERACGARALTVADPLLPAPDHLDAWRELRSYLGFRTMRTRLIAEAGVGGPDGVAALAAAQAVDGVHVQLGELAGLEIGLMAVLAARSHGLAVLLGGPNPVTLAHVALAARPDGVWVDAGAERPFAERPFAVQVEMQRAAAWLQQHP